MSEELLKSIDLSNEESISVISRLLDKENIRMKSDIKPSQLIYLMGIQIEAEEFGIPFIKGLVEIYLEDKVSENRESRKEVVKAYIGAMLTKMMKKQDVGLGEKL